MTIDKVKRTREERAITQQGNGKRLADTLTLYVGLCGGECVCVCVYVCGGWGEEVLYMTSRCGGGRVFYYFLFKRNEGRQRNAELETCVCV